MSLAVAALVCAGGLNAHAQTPHQLVPALTGQTPLPLSDRQGIPALTAANDAGDFAFVGQRFAALFYRHAGTTQTIRAVQYGDEVPGLSGSSIIQFFAPLLMTSSGLVTVRVDVATDNRITHAILAFDGTTLTTLATGRDTAPGTGGKKYERTMSLIDMNDAGDVLFGATLLPTGSISSAEPTIFLKPAGGAVVRVAGPADASGIGGTFSAVFGVGLSSGGQVLFNASITGGSAASGIFAWQGGVLRKVVAQGDVNPLGGTFTDTFTTAQMRQNAGGLIVFIAGNSLWQNTAGGGTSLAAGVGGATPAPIGGTYQAVLFLSALGASGDAVFGSTVAGGATGFAFYRFRPGVGAEVIAGLNEAAPGAPGKAFETFTQFSVNAAGTVIFQGNQAGIPVGIYRKPVGVALSPVVVNFAVAPGGGRFALISSPTQILTDGSVIVRSAIYDHQMRHAVYRMSASPETLMTTLDALPFGGRQIIRTTLLTAAGDWIGFAAQLAGGGESAGVLNAVVQTVQIVATDGDVMPGTGGKWLQLTNLNTVQVNSAGDLMVQAFLYSTNGIANAIVAGGAGHAFGVVTQSGDLDAGGRALTASQVGTRPLAINASGQVAFTAIIDNGARGLFIGSPGSTSVKVAQNGDSTSTGQIITAINAAHGGINEAGKVLFTANTSAGQGLYVGGIGQTPVKIAQVGDAAPGGGTFSGFGTTPAPGFNNNNQVAFMATVSGGTGGGIFLGSDIAAPVSIVLHGVGTPAGGNFVLTTPRPEVLINDAGDIAFMADITGGGADSGLFLKRGPLPIEHVVTQGQAAPGTAAGVFTTFRHAPTPLLNETHALSATGQIAFFGAAMPPSGNQIIGWWHRDTQGFVQPIQFAPSMNAAFDGGSGASTATISNWLTDDRFVVFVPVAGAAHAGGHYLYAPTGAGGATPTGVNVQASAADPLTARIVDVTFANVTGAGLTRVSRSASGPPLPRAWYRATGLSAYYNITTTATFTGSVTVCIDFGDHQLPQDAVLRLLHHENGAWVDVTSGPPAGTIICGVGSSLSPWVVAVALNVPGVDLIQEGDFSNGAAAWTKFDEPNGGISWAVSGGVFEYSRPGAAAVVFQPTGTATGAGQPLVATWDMGNTSSERKRFSVLIHNDFGAGNPDLAVCTFYLPPNAPMRKYAMRTHTTIPWQNATISIYAASGTSGGGVYRLDNVVMGPGHGLTTHRTDCVDPDAPVADDVPDGPPFISNGHFSTNDFTAWDDANIITKQVTNGVAQFIRPSVLPSGASGVLFQQTFQPVAAGQIVSARFRMGNSSNVRKRITVLLHAIAFNDLAACTFWLAPNQPLSDYSMRTWVSQAWASATISFYPATTDSLGWYELDDVVMSVTPGAPTYGTDCVEPGDTSGLSAPSQAPPSGGGPPAEPPVWAGLLLVDRRLRLV